MLPSLTHRALLDRTLCEDASESARLRLAVQAARGAMPQPTPIDVAIADGEAVEITTLSAAARCRCSRSRSTVPPAAGLLRPTCARCAVEHTTTTDRPHA